MPGVPRIHVDLATERLWRDGMPVPITRKVFRLLRTFLDRPGKLMTTQVLLAEVWPDTHVAEGSVKDCIKQLRALLNDRVGDPRFIETHRGRGYVYHGGILLLGEGEAPPSSPEVPPREQRGSASLWTLQRADPAPPSHLRPKLAVLPFLDHPATDERGALGDAVAQELTRLLARSQLTDVVAHLSSRRFNDDSVDIAAVVNKLDVDYLVTGRCKRSGDLLVLDVDFHNVASGNFVWSEPYTLTLGNFLAGQSARLHEIARSILRSILSISVELGASQPLPTLASHSLLMSAIALMYNLADGNFGRARNQFDEVAERSPKHALPRAWRAQWYLLRVFQGWSDDPRGDRQRAEDEVAAALDRNPECAFSLAMYGNVKTSIGGDFDLAERSLESALQLNSSSPLACRLKSMLRCYSGDGVEAVALAERAQSLSPCDPRGQFFDGMSAAAYLVDGKFDKAIALAECSLRANPRHVSAHRAMIVGLVRVGRMHDAADAARKLLARHPNMTVTGYLASHPAGHMPVGRDWAEALRDAGIPSG